MHTNDERSRVSPEVDRSRVYTFGRFEVFEELFELRRDGQRLAIQPRVFDLLAYLIGHRFRVVSKEELFENVWRGVSVAAGSLSFSVMKARIALDDNGGSQRTIQTVRGRGYRFVAKVCQPISNAAPSVCATRARLLDVRAPETLRRLNPSLHAES